MALDVNVGAIILDYDRPNLTDRCIESINSRGIIRIYVIENGLSNVESFRHRDQFVFIKNFTNLGFSGGMNVGIRRAISDGCTRVILINNDTTFIDGCIQLLIEALDSVDKVGIAVPNRSSSFGYTSKNKSYDSSLVISASAVDSIDTSPIIRDVKMITGFCMAFRSEVLREIGLLDEDFFFTREDDEISIRLREHNLRLIEVLNAHANHKVNSSLDICKLDSLRFLSYNSARGSALLCRKHELSVANQMLRTIYDASRLLIRTVFFCGDFHPTILTSSFRGFLDGLKCTLLEHHSR